MELIKIENNEIQVSQDFLNGYAAFLVEKQKWERQEQALKEELVQAMSDHNITSIENDVMKIKYVAPTVKKSIDTDALKEQGLYDSFLKESQVKASVRISIK